MTSAASVSLGLDFGTESVRALLIDLEGNELATATEDYHHGQIIDCLPTSGETLPADFALQHPTDWIDSAAAAVRSALQASGLTGDRIVGIGVDFTSCTMLPALEDGTPLCLLDQWSSQPLAWLIDVLKDAGRNILHEGEAS